MCQKWPSQKDIRSKLILEDFAFTLTSDLERSSSSLFKHSVGCVRQIKPRVQKLLSGQRFFLKICCNLTLTQKLSSRSLHTFYPQANIWEVKSEPNWAKGKENIFTNGFKRCTMTFNFDLETWIKVTAHLLPKGPFLGEERARFGQGEEIVLWTSDIRQTHRMTQWSL